MDMEPSRFTEEQIIGILREQEAGAKTADVCRSATFYKWKAKFGGLEVSDAKRLRARENENTKLKKLLAEAMLDNAMLKEIAAKKMVPPAARREAVAQLRVDHPEQSATSYSVGDDSSLEGCTTSRTGGGKFRNSPRQRYQRLALARPCLF
jgi:putative transposase